MGTPQPAGHRYMPEVEGLRAVAAVLVAVYHVFLGRVSGGVDVFFVIAGFLITTSLLGQAAGGHHVHAGRYLARLAVRLLPVAVAVLVVVVVGCLLWIPETRRVSVLAEVLASVLYVENWALALKAVDYAARDEVKSPVQHFWAMSVQGQFYLLWLGLVGAIALITKPAHLRMVLGLALGVVFTASLAFSVWLTATNQPFAYFHTGTRVWEFAAGSLLAVVIEPVIRFLGRLGAGGVVIRGVAGWAGLALVVCCGLVLQVSAAFPGIAALWPVAGAVLVVLAAGGGGRWSVSRVLGSAPFVFVGGVAYAIYLWHWPMLTFARLRTPAGTIDPLTGVAVLAASFILAVVSTKLVEQPVRRRFASTAHPWRVVSIGAAGLLIVVPTLLALTWSSAGLSDSSAVGMAVPAIDEEAMAVEMEDLAGAEAADPTSGRADDPAEPVAPTRGSGAPGGEPEQSATATARAQPASTIPPISQARSQAPFSPGAVQAAADTPDITRTGCQQQILEPSLVICTRGAPNGTRTAFLMGGSHAAQWYPPLNAIAKRRGWTLVTGLKAGCRVTQTREFSEEADDQSCKAWLDELLAYLRRHPPDFVITTGTATNPRKEWVPSGYLDVWRMLEARGIPVIVIRDTPRADFDRVDCLAQHGSEPWACDISRQPTLAAENPLHAIDLPSNVLVADMSPYLCTADWCPAVIDHRVVYRDAHHLSATFARSLAPMLAAQIPKDPVATIAGQ